MAFVGLGAMLRFGCVVILCFGFGGWFNCFGLFGLFGFVVGCFLYLLVSYGCVLLLCLGFIVVVCGCRVGLSFCFVLCLL